jgi:uncharacterized membrane protein
VDPLPRLIAHHVTTTVLVLEIAAVLALIVALGIVGLRGRRRHVDRQRRVARMRDDDV